MSNHDNHRRGEKKRTETGPTWENRDPGAGCNSTHVARSRKKWKRIGARAERRTGGQSLGGYHGTRAPYASDHVFAIDEHNREINPSCLVCGIGKRAHGSPQHD